MSDNKDGSGTDSSCRPIMWTSTTEGSPEVCMCKINPVPNILQFFGVAVFFTVFTVRRYSSARFFFCRPVSVRPFVCPSVTLVDCIHTAEDIVKLPSRPGSAIILVVWSPAPVSNSKGNPFSEAQNTREVRKFCDFRLKSLSISEMVRDRPMVAMER